MDEIVVQFIDRQVPHTGMKQSWTTEIGVEILERGTIRKPGALPLPCNIIYDKHFPVTLRDGSKIYCDAFRPEVSVPIPAIICGGPYGKNGGPFSDFTDQAPFRFGIPQRSVSGLEKFEGVDPAYWCFHGYAVIHPDPRGVGSSEGDTYMSCKRDALDYYDLIEFLAEQKWCNGRVTMAGNSWLTQIQWFTAAEKPPHLTCICPSEGWSDFYNDTICRGGIPFSGFWEWLLRRCTVGRGRVEDVTAMIRDNPHWNEYWEERRAELEKINIPTLMVASWSSLLHTGGTFRAWETISSKEKWLRIHRTNEWPDLYDPTNVDEARKFLDHYMKDINNGWEYTPRVQMCVLNPGHEDVVNRPESSFPLEREQQICLFLDVHNRQLSESLPAKSQHAEISADQGSLIMQYKFLARTELSGHFYLRLFVEAVGSDDLDVFARWDKWNVEKDQAIEHVNVDVGYLQPDPEAAREKL